MAPVTRLSKAQASALNALHVSPLATVALNLFRLFRRESFDSYDRIVEQRLSARPADYFQQTAGLDEAIVGRVLVTLTKYAMNDLVRLSRIDSVEHLRA